MNFLRGIKRICDVSFYMTFVSLLAYLSGEIFGSDFNHFIPTLPIFIGIMFLSSFLTRYGWVKYLSIPLVLLVFLFIPLTLINLIILIPIAIYLVWESSKKIERIALLAFDYSVIFRLFIKFFCGSLIGFFFLRFFWEPEAIFPIDAILYALTFLIAAIIFTRTKRHDEAILKEFRFKVINTVTLIGVGIGAVLVMAGNFLLDPLLRFFRFIYLEFLVQLFDALLHALGILLTPIFERFQNLPFAELPRPEIQYSPDGSWLLSRIIALTFALILVLSAVIIVVLAIVRLVKWLLSRKSPRLRKKKRTIREDGVEEEYFLLEEKVKNFGHQNQIRGIYRDFLKLLQKHEMIILRNWTSKKIENEVANQINPEVNSKKLSELRAAYIKVRYGEAMYTKDELKHVKGLYKEIKKEIESFS